MASLPTANEVISVALRLPEEQRLAVIGALHASMADSTIDHGEVEDAVDAQAAWKLEIERRIEEVLSGKVKTIPADVAERMIRGDASI